jgi:membrane-anchored protein YejM (alkaline phosphatase superfamily)
VAAVVNPIELAARDHLRLARLHLVTSAIIFVLAADEAATSRRLRVWALLVLVLALVNMVFSLHRVFRLGKRVHAAIQLASALQVGTDADIEIAWMNLLYLQDPATSDEPTRKQSPFRQLRRDRPRLVRVLRLGHR